jgi:glycosyltransferase involved in cell wall biosynthesis
MPAVSVITPAYNVAPYIAATLDSALRQSFRDFELIVVDDGSTDDTATIVTGFAARDKRIRLVRKPNGGLSSARNAALDAARGDYIALLDGDDLWGRSFLDAQLALLRSEADVSLVTGNAFFLGGSRDGEPVRPVPDTRREPTLAAILADEEAVFIMTVFRRTVFETIGGFDETMRTNEDYDFWLRAALAGFKFARNDKPLGVYRRRGDSLSAGDVRMLRGILHVYAKTRPALHNLPVERAILDRQVQRFEVELLAAEARAAIERGDFQTAAMNLDALHARRPRTAVRIARLLVHWTPSLLSRAYGLRRARHAFGARLPS